MRVVADRDAPSDPAPYTAADAVYADAKAYLSSREAQQMSESDLERELNRRGQELLRKLLQGHLDQRSPGEAAGPVAGADGVERAERRVHERHLETTFGTVEVERVGYARAGHESLHPLDASLNLPPERYSLEVRRRVAEAAASRSFDEALFELSRHTGAEVPKRQAEQLAARAAEDFDAFYEARRAAAGEPSPEGSVVVLTFDGKGVVLHREDLREATRKAAERRRRQREPRFPFPRLQPGEKKHAKRMATVAAVYTVAPFVRSPEEFLQSLMPRSPEAKTRARKSKPPVVRPRPVAKRVWASLEREPAEVVAEALLEAERRDPERVKRWVVLVDGAEMQLDLVEAGAAAYGVDVTVVLDIIHVVEYVWKAAHVFHREESLEREYWAWTRVRSHSRGQGSVGGGGDAACGDRRPPAAGPPQAGRYVRRLPAEVRAVSTLRPLPRGGLSHRHGGDRGGVPAPGPRPDGVDRRPLAAGRRRGGPEAAGVTSQRRLRRLLGLPRSARVRTEPRPTLCGRDSTAGHRAAPTALLSPSSTGQVALLPCRSQNALNLSGPSTKKSRTQLRCEVPVRALSHVQP